MAPDHSTVEMSAEVELRRLRFFIGRLGYVRQHMAGGEQAMLDALVAGASEEYWRDIDAAIDRERAEY
jgi:hypothetical protein